MAHTQADVEQASKQLRNHGQWGYRGHTIIAVGGGYQVVPYVERIGSIKVTLISIDMLCEGQNAGLTMRAWTMRR